MLIVTTDSIAGFEVTSVLGEVLGLAVRSSNFGITGLSSGLRNFDGAGEYTDHTRSLYEMRNVALRRLWDQTVQRGGNAVVGCRFTNADLSDRLTEVCAYGTGVVVRPLAEGEAGATRQSIRAAMEESEMR